MHHAIMNVLEPVFERQFIFHTYACRKNKGSHKAVLYTLEKVRKCKYFIKLDVRKYFDNIDHEILKKMLSRIKKDRECLNLLFAIIDSYGLGQEGRGLPIGNLTSQFFANFYLSFLDHYILEELKPCGYVRYMDDFILFSNSKDGVSFLGYMINKNGIKLTQKSRRRKLIKLKRLNYNFEIGKVLEEEYVTRIKCIYAVCGDFIMLYRYCHTIF